jgi:serine protease Do
VTRGWLGVSIQSLSDELAEYYGAKSKKGALVAGVEPGDPADKAGIRAKDIIIEINGKQIEDPRDLTRMVADIPVGESADVLVLREGKPKKFKVEVGKRDDSLIAGRSESGKPAPAQNALGIRVEEITPEMATRHNLPETEGVIVSGLSPDGKGAKAGLQSGDIIKEINHEAIASLSDYSRVMDGLNENSAISMFIRRANAGYQVINIKP